MKVVFVSYGRFDSNSGGHIARFAAGLAGRGHAVAVFAEGDPAGARDFGVSGFAAFPRRALQESPARALAFDGRGPEGELVVHAWTPREAVRGVVHRVRRHAPREHRLVVHLEDDETLLTAAQLGRSWAQLSALAPGELDPLVRPSLSHPHRMASFLAEADGVTAIVPPLFELAPAEPARHLLQPGADLAEIGPPLRHDQRAELLSRLGVPVWHRIVAYPGNLHPANRREMFSLYVAVHVLRRRGWGVTLLRTGDDYGPGLDVAFQHLRGEVSRELGRLPRREMLAVLKLADVLVQPGAPDTFNQRRLPSKLPEFLATGIPVVLPRANLGLLLADGREAVALDAGHGLEIADKVDALFREPERAAAIGAAGRAFALRRLDWERAVAGLEGFYAALLQRPSRTAAPAPVMAA
ncbi:MAG: glycosyltransferase [Caulobacteraceae bacterium]|nr:glycosyltransferase [Caulobacter sp.]